MDSLLTSCNDERKIESSDISTVYETGNDARNFRRSKKPHSDKWKPDETDLFYVALGMFGMDFGMISKFMKNRTRNQIKSKYKKESKVNPERIDSAFSNKIEIDKDKYQQYVAKLGVLEPEVKPQVKLKEETDET